MSSFLKIAAILVLSMAFIYNTYAVDKDTAPPIINQPRTTSQPLSIGSFETNSPIAEKKTIPESFCGRPPIGPRKKFSFEGYANSPEAKSPSKRLEIKQTATLPLPTSKDKHRLTPTEKLASSPEDHTSDTTNNIMPPILVPGHTPTLTQKNPTGSTVTNNSTDGESSDGDGIFKFEQ